jgi:hypothetical protein
MSGTVWKVSLAGVMHGSYPTALGSVPEPDHPLLVLEPPASLTQWAHLLPLAQGQS